MELYMWIARWGLLILLVRDLTHVGCSCEFQNGTIAILAQASVSNFVIVVTLFDVLLSPHFAGPCAGCSSVYRELEGIWGSLDLGYHREGQV